MANLVSCNDLIRTNIFLSLSDKKVLQARAKKQGVSFATLIRQIMATAAGSKSDPFEFRTEK